MGPSLARLCSKTITLVFALAALASLWVPGLARAQNCDLNGYWQKSLPSSPYGVGTAIWTATDRGQRFCSGCSDTQSKVFVVKGSYLIALWDATTAGHAAGDVAWYKPFSQTISSMPVLFPRSSDLRPTLVVGVGGLVYVLNPEVADNVKNANMSTQELLIDTRRGTAGTYANDQVGYTPVVQLASPDYYSGGSRPTVDEIIQHPHRCTLGDHRRLGR